MLTIHRRHWLMRILREVFYGCARPLQQSYWFIFRPYRPGAKTFVINQDRLLLVRLGYAHRRWVLPGGGIERGESALQAAVREVKEESGLTITDPDFIGERKYNNQYKKVTVSYFATEVSNYDLIIDGQEITDAGWFSPDALPTDIMPKVKEEVILYNNWKYGNK